MANEFKVVLISDCFVRPKYMVEQSKKPHYLSTKELKLLSIEYMQGGLLYRKPTSTSFNINSDLLNKLKRSLSLALVHFYPLAGRLETVKFEEEHACWIYVHCNKGPGARFIHSTVSQVSVSDIVSRGADVPRIVRSFFDLGDTKMVNHDGHTEALLSVQVTELVDGVFIGFSINHSVADGTSFWHFVNTLSEIYTQLEDGGDDEKVKILHAPIFNSLVVDGYYGDYGPILKLPYLDPSEFIFRVDINQQLREKFFYFSPASMAKLKSEANNSEGGQKVSSFQALTGLVWRAITRARNSALDEETSCIVVADSRSRLNPPLSFEHFGSMAVVSVATCRVSDLLENGFDYAATLLHQAVISVDDRKIRSMLTAEAKEPSRDRADSFPKNHVLIAGSTRFGMFEPQFGLGEVITTRTGYFSKKVGKIQATPGREGPGSVALEICHWPETMSALGKDEEFLSYIS